MSKAVEYNIPYGEDEWNINYSGTDVTPQSNTLWKCLTKLHLKARIETAPASGYNHAVNIENYRSFECICKAQEINDIMTDYNTLKGWEGNTVTLTPHTDESGITYSCKIQLTSIFFDENDPYNWILYCKLIETEVI